MSEHPRYPLLPAEDTIKALTEAEAEAIWLRLRWVDGEPACPECGGNSVYDVRRSDLARWRCKSCVKEFSLTSGTPFAHHKLPIRAILLMISLVQRGDGGMVIRRIAQEQQMDYKTAYTLIGKAQEMLTGGIERKSMFVGYMSGGRPSLDAPRARIPHLLERKSCAECGAEKPSSEFGLRCGVAKDWGLSATVCKACIRSRQKITARDTWAQRKVASLATPIIERSVTDLLSKPRWRHGYLWSSGMTWTPQERHDLTVMANANVSADATAIALGRSAKSVAWYARDLLPSQDIPLEWRRLITPPRLSVPAQPRLLVYPYLPELRKNAEVSGAQLTIDVSALVSRAYPDFMRADICQIVLLAILEGHTTLDSLRGAPDALRSFVKGYRRDQDAPRMVGSLDAPRWDNDDDDAYGSTLPAGVMNRLEW